MLVFPMDTPGVTLRPIELLDGGSPISAPIAPDATMFRYWERGERVTTASAMAKLYASEVAVRASESRQRRLAVLILAVAIPALALAGTSPPVTTSVATLV